MRKEYLRYAQMHDPKEGQEEPTSVADETSDEDGDNGEGDSEE